MFARSHDSRRHSECVCSRGSERHLGDVTGIGGWRDGFDVHAVTTSRLSFAESTTAH